MASEIAKAYVQIIPTAEGIKGKLTSMMAPEASAAGKVSGAGFSTAFGGLVGGAATVATAAIGAATAGVVALTSKAVEGYGRYEQLIGGVDKLYGSASQKVQQFAAEAYKTSGMSANAYMESATSFSAALITSLEGDVNKAADMTDIAMRAMSDNVNVFGSNMGDVEHAFQGFAKQNYTMLDNLKLGYGGTKTEMERLVKDASQLTDVQSKLGLTVDESSLSFANIVAAIQVMQTEMGIAGTTQAEAAGTIEGSLTSVKAAWDNLITGLANDNADFQGLVDNLITSLVGKDGGGLVNNIMPRIKTAMQGIAKMIVSFAPIIGSQLPPMISSLLPSLSQAVGSLISALAQALPGLITTVLQVIPSLFNTCMQVLTQNLPKLMTVALNAIVTLAKGLGQSLPTLIPQLVNIVITMTETIVNNADKIIEGAIALIAGLATGLINALPRLIEKAPEIVLKLLAALIRNAPKILQAGAELIIMLVNGIVQGWHKLFQAGTQAVNAVKNGFSGKIAEATSWGRDMIQNFINGIMSKWNALRSSVASLARTVKSYIGFSEPEKGPLSNFHTFAPDMVELFAKGIKDNEDVIGNQLNDSLSNVAVPVQMGIDTTASTGNTATSIAPTINVYGAEGQDVNELANIVMDKINALVYREGAVYA